MTLEEKSIKLFNFIHDKCYTKSLEWNDSKANYLSIFKESLIEDHEVKQILKELIDEI